MLKDEPVCEPKIESLINDMQDNLIISSLNKGLNVIIDNTNLKESYIKHFVDLVKYHASVEFQLFDISIDKAIERNKNRTKKVPEDVIRKHYEQYKILIDSFDFSNVKSKTKIYTNPKFEISLEDAIICDIDGTLAHMNGKRGPFDWDKVDRDDLDEVVAAQLTLHKNNGHKIIIVSGRDGSCLKLSKDWLDFYGVPYDEIYFRAKDDNRKDSIIKAEIYNNNIKGRYNIKVVYDDRNQVVDMWRELGLKVLQVEDGNF